MKRFIILAGVDLSESSRGIVDQAFELASAHPRAEVPIAAVEEPTLEVLSAPHEEARSWSSGLRELAHAAIKRFESSHALSSIERVTVHTSGGDPTHELVAIAAEVDADLMVVGTHWRRGPQRALLGSVAERVVRTAGCPVLVVRAKAHAEALKVPEIEPLCAECAGTRRASGGRELWCALHAAHHVRAHVYSDDEPGRGESRPWGFST